uniref:uncharacterized protein LOC118541117 n=1 Tax=Halichoerus grypus TaxID=9711 RepID=UPI0016595366|nr:uncharacterized protein LOC118541117 [Halichoerus grypus]
MCCCPQVLGRLLWRPHPGLRPAVRTLPLSWAPWLWPLSWDFLPCGQCKWTCPIPLCTWLCRLSGCIRGTHRPQGYRKAPETTHPYLDPFRAPAATAVPLATLGTLGQGETPEGARAGPVSATISVPVIMLPATPTVGTAGAVCTTPKVPAVPTAGLASMAVPCVQGAAGMSVWLGWVRISQGRWVRSLSSDPSYSPGCSCDPRALSLHGAPLGLKPASATRCCGPGLLSCPAFPGGPAWSPGYGHIWRTGQQPGKGPRGPAVDGATASGGMQGLGTWDGCVPVPCVVPSCPGTLPTAQWVPLASRNSSDSLDTAATALEQHQQLMQQIQATASATGIQARETWHRTRGPWGVATIAHVQATVQILLLGLERRLVQNEQILGKKIATLWALELRAAELLEHMRLWGNVYATC